MSKNLTRHMVRRKLGQCADLCDNIQQHLADCAQPFIDAERKETDAFYSLGIATEQLKELFLSVREKI